MDSSTSDALESCSPSKKKKGDAAAVSVDDSDAAKVEEEIQFGSFEEEVKETPSKKKRKSKVVEGKSPKKDKQVGRKVKATQSPKGKKAGQKKKAAKLPSVEAPKPGGGPLGILKGAKGKAPKRGVKGPPEPKATKKAKTTAPFNGVYNLPSLPVIDLTIGYKKPLKKPLGKGLRNCTVDQLEDCDLRSKLFNSYLDFYVSKFSLSQNISDAKTFIDPSLLKQSMVVFMQHANAEISSLKTEVLELAAQNDSLERSIVLLGLAGKQKSGNSDQPTREREARTPASLLTPNFSGIDKFDGKDEAVDILEWILAVERKLSVASTHLKPHYLISHLGEPLFNQFYDKFRPQDVVTKAHKTDMVVYELIRSELIDTYKSRDAGDRAHKKLQDWSMTENETVHAGVTRLAVLLKSYSDLGEEMSETDRFRILHTGLLSDIVERIASQDVDYRDTFDYAGLIVEAVQAEKFVLAFRRKKGNSNHAVVYAAAQMIRETAATENASLNERLMALESQREKFQNRNGDRKSKGDKKGGQKTEFVLRKTDKNPTGLNLKMSAFKDNYSESDWTARCKLWKDKGKPSDHPKWYQGDKLTFEGKEYLVCTGCKRAAVKGDRGAHQMSSCKRYMNGPPKK